jgi:glycosyltransferase involved in cell wall biosynthesis
MPANYRGALYYNLAAAAIARLRGWRVAVHHHVYYYLNRYDWRIRLLDRLLPKGSAHLVLCCEMSRELAEKYQFRAERRLLPSTILLTNDFAAGPPANHTMPRAVRRLGHISNLSVAKGTLDACRVFTTLRKAGYDVELIVAGPIMDSAVQQELDGLRERHGAHLDYRGPAYGDDKRRFFEDVDVVLFPSKMEAQPIVLSEAFAFGKPVIAKSLSCIPSLIAEPSWTINPQEDFGSNAADLLARWIQNPGDYGRAREHAFGRASALRLDAEEKQRDFVRWIRGETGSKPSPEAIRPEHSLLAAEG